MGWAAGRGWSQGPRRQGGEAAGQDRYLARSRTHEPGSYFELWVSPWGHVRRTCPGFTYRGVCKHAEALKTKMNMGNKLGNVPSRQIAETLVCLPPYR